MKEREKERRKEGKRSPWLVGVFSYTELDDVKVKDWSEKIKMYWEYGEGSHIWHQSRLQSSRQEQEQMAKQKPMRNTSLRYFGVLQVKWDFHIFLHLVVCSPPAI